MTSSHLEERRELVQVLHRHPRVHEPALVRELTVRPHQDLPRDRLSEDLQRGGGGGFRSAGQVAPRS